MALLAPGVSAAVFTPGAPDADPPTGDAVATTTERAAEPLRAPGFEWVLAPWRRAGTVSMDMRALRLEDGQTNRQGAVSTDIEWDTYLWQPWFLQLRLGLGLLAVRDAASGRSSGIDSDVGGTSGAATGRMALALFPASRFPFEFRADLGDSRASGDTLGADVRTQRLSLSQSYRPETGNQSLHLQIDRSRLQSAGSTDTLTTLQLQGQQESGSHSVDAGAHLSFNERSDLGERNRLASLNARHGFHPSPSLQVDTMASWNDTRLRGSSPLQQDFGTEVRQLTTVLSWRPREGEPLYDEHRPVQLAASARWVDVVATADNRRQGSQAYAGTLGASVDLSTTWRLSASASGSRLQGQGDASINNLGLNATASWTPLGILIGAWRYTPSTSVNVAVFDSSDTGLRKLAGAQASHGVSRDWAVAEGQVLALSLSQSLGALRESQSPRLAVATSHSLGLFWQGTTDTGSQRFASLSVSDSRNRAASDGLFQLVNLQLSQRTQLSRQSGWSVNFTAQASRSEASAIDVFTGERRQQGKGWQHFYSGGASLDQQRVFGVPRLRHTLQLTFNSQQLERRALGDIDAPRERISQALESRLDYSIGRLELRASIRHAQVDGRAVSSFIARLQRRF